MERREEAREAMREAVKLAERVASERPRDEGAKRFVEECKAALQLATRD
jgi:hypothetical protein